MTEIKLPKSASNPVVVGLGFLSLVLSLFVVKNSNMAGNDIALAVLFCMGVSAAIILSLDFFWQKVYLRETTGLNFSQHHASWKRTFIKLLGLLGSIGFVALLYWLFTEYHGDFYNRYWKLLQYIAPFWAVAAIPYFYFVDAKMKDPKDGYWQMGQLLLLNFKLIDRGLLGQQLLGWLIKGFFLPLMLTYFCNDLTRFSQFNFSTIVDFKTFFDFTYDNIFLIDVGVVSIGYLASLKLFDTHIRSAEPTMLGWIVALVCYEPFWSTVGNQYIDYSTDFAWGAWLSDSPVLYTMWGSGILILFAIYVWASVMFGCRFSNLTHRGILTNGPYRFSKHPAYVAKNLAWWMISVPFMAAHPSTAIQKCLLLLMLNIIYYLRAKTEERNLSQDPTYVQYANWMDHHGMFRWTRGFPFVKLRSLN